MRKDIFLAIVGRIREQVPEIRYVDLWNEHLTEIQGGTAWPVPALFIEFEPYDVNQAGNRCTAVEVPVRLHIITRVQNYAGSADSRMTAALQYFDLLDSVHRAMSSLAPPNATTFMLTRSETSHYHAELMDNVERYITQARGGAGARPFRAVAPGPQTP